MQPWLSGRASQPRDAASPPVHVAQELRTRSAPGGTLGSAKERCVVDAGIPRRDTGGTRPRRFLLRAEPRVAIGCRTGGTRSPYPRLPHPDGDGDPVNGAEYGQALCHRDPGPTSSKTRAKSASASGTTSTVGLPSRRCTLRGDPAQKTVRADTSALATIRVPLQSPAWTVFCDKPCARADGRR